MKHHLLIAGTGRAGTSFLVQYLTACGLETHQTLHPDAKLDENANAGLEDVPVPGVDMPYVLKSPWLYEFVERLLERDDIQLDAVVMPMRDIVEAATSRVTLSLQERFGNIHLDQEHTLWETWGTAPGGVVYSLNPIDQARLLAMGFHQVIHALVHKDVPIVFLDFPRLVTDGDYLFEQLRPVIGSKVSWETAIEAHRKTARPEFVRTGNELSGPTLPSADDTVARFPTFETVDRAALFRELRRAQMSEQSAIRRTEEANRMLEGKERQLAASQSEVGRLTQCCAETQAALNQAQSRLSLADAQVVTIEAEHVRSREQVREFEAEHVRLREQVRQFEKRLGACNETLSAVLSSTSWKMTSPLRRVIGGLRRSRRRGSDQGA
ncbi:hypothetical protein [Paraburkholderia sp. A1RO-5L]|uniref:hypothetical protein n=1 Tax=Paraburkholderia sp. A1RO-5L TaxID=3028370 RepID=UPI003B76DAFD